MKSKSPKEWVHLIDEECGLYNRLSLIHHLNETFARAAIPIRPLLHPIPRPLVEGFR